MNPRKPSSPNKIRTVEFVAADARCHVHEAVARVGAGEQRSEFRDDFAHLEVEAKRYSM